MYGVWGRTDWGTDVSIQRKDATIRSTRTRKTAEMLKTQRSATYGWDLEPLDKHHGTAAS